MMIYLCKYDRFNPEYRIEATGYEDAAENFVRWMTREGHVASDSEPIRVRVSLGGQAGERTFLVSVTLVATAQEVK